MNVPLQALTRIYMPLYVLTRPYMLSEGIPREAELWIHNSLALPSMCLDLPDAACQWKKIENSKKFVIWSVVPYCPYAP